MIDATLVRMFWQAGYQQQQLQALNRCWLAHHLILKSDMTLACRRSLDLLVLAPPPPGFAQHCSSYVFPKSHPSWTDWKLWLDFLDIYHRQQGNTAYPARRMDTQNTQNMAVVLLQVQWQLISERRQCCHGIHSYHGLCKSMIMAGILLGRRHWHITWALRASKQNPNRRWYHTHEEHWSATGKNCNRNQDFLDISEVTRRRMDVGEHSGNQDGCWVDKDRTN